MRWKRVKKEDNMEIKQQLLNAVTRNLIIHHVSRITPVIKSMKNTHMGFCSARS